MLIPTVFAAAVLTRADASPGSQASASTFDGRDGAIVFATRRADNLADQIHGRGKFDLFSINPDGTGQRALTSDPRDDIQPAVSPNGKQIAFVRRPGGKNDREILVMDADGSSVRSLVRNRVEDHGPVFSPDGSRIAFVSTASGERQIWIINSNGGQATRLTETPGAKSHLTFSPDGSQILYAGVLYDRTPFGHDAILRISSSAPMQTAATEVGRLTPDQQIWGFSLSAKGTRRVLAYRQRTRSGFLTSWDTWHIYLGQAGGACGACNTGDWGKFPGTQRTAGSSDDFRPALSPEGSRFVFERGNDLYVAQTTADDLGRLAPPRRLTSNAGTDVQPDWGPAP